MCLSTDVPAAIWSISCVRTRAPSIVSCRTYVLSSRATAKLAMGDVTPVRNCERGGHVAGLSLRFRYSTCAARDVIATPTRNYERGGHVAASLNATILPRQIRS